MIFSPSSLPSEEDRKVLANTYTRLYDSDIRQDMPSTVLADGGLLLNIIVTNDGILSWSRPNGRSFLWWSLWILQCQHIRPANKAEMSTVLLLLGLSTYDTVEGFTCLHHLKSRKQSEALCDEQNHMGMTAFLLMSCKIYSRRLIVELNRGTLERLRTLIDTFRIY